MVEAKFWAGLTGNQPVAYLKRLPTEAEGLLLFVAPARRFETLWPELLRRCHDENVAVQQSNNDTAQDFRAVRVGSTTHTLALTSWRAVLAHIQRALETQGEHRAASDVQQLQGLCERMDSGAFLPLRSEELTSDAGARIRQYCDIVDEVTSKAVAAGIVSVGGLKATGGAAYYGRYMTFPDALCFLHFGANLWTRLRATPLWLRIGRRKVPYPWLKEALASLEREDPPRLIVDGNYVLMPLYMPIGVERRGVVSVVFEQVKEVAQLLHDYERAK